MKSKKLRAGITFGISILILVSALVFTDVAAAKTKVNIQAEKSRYLKKQGLYIIEGNPFIKYKDYTISADLIKYFEDDDRAIFTGNVVVIQNETRIHADSMKAELKDEEFIIDGNVDIYYVRKKEQAEESKDAVSDVQVVEDVAAGEVATDVDGVAEEPEAGAKEGEATEEAAESKNDVIKIRAQHVEFSKVNDADLLIAETDVWMETDDQTITSEYLEYKGDQEVVVARQNVKVVGTDEEELFSDEFTYWLEGEEEGFEATGGVKLEFFMDSDEEEDADAKADEQVTKAQGEPTEDSLEAEAAPADEVIDEVTTPAGEEQPAEDAGE